MDDTHTAAKAAMKDVIYNAGEKAGDVAEKTKDKASDMAAGNFFSMLENIITHCL